MTKYAVVIADKVDRQLLRHVEFLSRVSVPAARRFRNDFGVILNRLEENPLQFPQDTDPNLPSELYRKALFSKWYKALFMIEGQTVYLDAIIDCRQSVDALDL